MKRIFLSALFACVMLIAPAAGAVGVLDPICDTEAGANAAICKDDRSGHSADNPIFGKNGVLTVAIRYTSFAVGVIAVIVIIISGLRMTLASGDSSSIANARRGIIFALVALVVAALAQSIVAFVLVNI